jgi:hypothetical protein
VEVNGREYAYGGNSLLDCTGVYEMFPRSHDVFTFKYSIEVGQVDGEHVIQSALNKLMKKYKCNQYDMLTLNCNHFTHEFLQLLVGRGLPNYLNRAAYLGSFLHCLVPRKYLIVTPPGADTSGKSNWDMVSGEDSKSTVMSSRLDDSDDDDVDDDIEEDEDDDSMFEGGKKRRIVSDEDE